MSHSIAEIVLPPMSADTIKDAVSAVMDAFRDKNDDETLSDCGWWDYWQIGGRWSGNKTIARIEKSRLDEFCAELNRRKVQVHAFVAGKEEITTPAQVLTVDTLWREWFPGMGDHCQLFAHSGNGGDIVNDNYCTVADLPEGLECERLIVAGFDWGDDPDKLTAKDMLATSYWNRCRHQKTDYDGNVKAGVERIVAEQAKNIEEANERAAKRGEFNQNHIEWVARHQRSHIKPDWIVVTVDYHH